MAHDFGVSANAYHAAAELILQSGVDALDGATLIVAKHVSRLMANASAAFVFGGQFLF